MTVTIEKIKELELDYEFAKARLQAAKDEYAAELCPFTVGDVVNCCGYTYQGKEMEVQKIWLEQTWHQELIWRCSGIILKADGEHSKHRANFDQNQWERQK